MLDHLSAASVALASGATEVRTTAKQIHIPRITAAGAVGWYAELEPIAPSGPDGDELVLTPRKVAALCRLSNEAVNDSNPRILDVVGASMVRAVALEADRAIFAGTGAANDQPLGIVGQVTANIDAAPSFAGIVGAAGLVRAAGARPTCSTSTRPI